MELSQSSTHDPLAQPEKIGHFELRRLLGEGAFGHVYEAWDGKLQRSIALKRMKSAVASIRSGSLLEEGRVAAALDHDAFVKIFSIEGDGDQQSIIMELVRGQTLRDLIAQHHANPCITVEQVLNITLQIAQAMAVAHASNLVHGDIKPGNLMIEASGKVRILDFGLARELDPMATETGPVEDNQGTIAYMTPERLLGQAANSQSDIYSLGVVLYELIVGARPFSELNGLALAAAHIQSSSNNWRFPATTNPAIVNLIRSMTAHDPAERLPSMQDVIARIQALQTNAPVPETSAATAPRRQMPRWEMRHAAWLLVLPVAIGIGYLGWRRVVDHAWPSLLQKPYLEATAIKSGLEALRNYDLDSTQATAIESFNEVLSHNPNSAMGAAGLALAYDLKYMGAGRDDVWLQRADAGAQRALSLDGELALAHVARAWTLELQGKQQDSLGEEDKALSLDPHNFFALYGKVRLLTQMNNFSDAEKLESTILTWHPREHLSYERLGVLKYRAGDYKSAEAAFRNEIQYGPVSPLGYVNLSATLLHLNRADDALDVLQQGLAIRPDARLYSNLGSILFSRANYVAAAQAFENAVSSEKGSPNDYLKWANLADALRWIPGREQSAREAYERAIQLAAPMLERMPNDPTLLSRTALYHARESDKQAALTLINQAVEHGHKSPEVHFRAALINELTGNRELALNELKEAKTLGYPSNLIESEPDLIELRRDQRYQHLILESAR